MRTRPNIVVILADDLGYGDPSHMGGPWHTPRMDALAASGLRCTDFLANGPVCSPSRAAILTGHYQQRYGIEGVVSAAGHRDCGLDPAAPSFVRALRTLGYRTALFGKWHLGYDPAFGPRQFGFETFRGFVSGNVDYHSHVDQAGYADWWQDEELLDEPGYVTAKIAEHARQFIADHRDEPFCLVLPHAAPHYPYQGPDDRPERSPGGDFVIHGWRSEDPAAARDGMAAVMTAFDAAIGDTVDAIDAAGLGDDTIIIVTSDHGAPAPSINAPLRAGKASLYEGGVRVPCLVRYPRRIAPGTVSSATVMGMDLAPSLLAAAGGDWHGDGRSWWPALAGDQLAERSLCWRFQDQQAVRQGRWKWIRPQADAAPELYDLNADLSETVNLAAAHPERCQAMAAVFADWETDVCAKPMLA